MVWSLILMPVNCVSGWIDGCRICQKCAGNSQTFISKCRAPHADDWTHGGGWLRGCGFSGLCNWWLQDGSPQRQCSEAHLGRLPHLMSWRDPSLTWAGEFTDRLAFHLGERDYCLLRSMLWSSSCAIWKDLRKYRFGTSLNLNSTYITEIFFTF